MPRLLPHALNVLVALHDATSCSYGVLADLTRRIAPAGVDLDLVYVATRSGTA